MNQIYTLPQRTHILTNFLICENITIQIGGFLKTASPRQQAIKPSIKSVNFESVILLAVVRYNFA